MIPEHNKYFSAISTSSHRMVKFTLAVLSGTFFDELGSFASENIHFLPRGCLITHFTICKRHDSLCRIDRSIQTSACAP